ncbi:MAG TPA: alpha/beta hydrolase [Methanocorpusculum sp.]|jgi:pimeloyl-ACP methyl ester carboxylesterase|nr:alpha/beta hydrolase [Methanocorpusculum sp.]HJJ88006.1 alpha/beta hydrolase [Methanocorpusculum sp.]
MISLAYKKAGEGKPLILLHGNGGSSADFALQTNYFSGFREVISVDTRGHGNSPRGDVPMSFPQFAKDILAFLDEQEIEKADIIGFSDGANTAILFAAENPKRVGKLILCGACTSPKAVKRSVQIPIEIGYWIASRFKNPKARKNAEILGLMVNDFGISEEHLRQIQAETLVLAGTKDMIRESHTKMIAETIPQAKLMFLEGDHFLPMKRANAFNRAVEEFLKEE